MRGGGNGKECALGSHVNLRYPRKLLVITHRPVWSRIFHLPSQMKFRDPYRICPLIGSFVRTKALNESCAPMVIGAHLARHFLLEQEICLRLPLNGKTCRRAGFSEFCGQEYFSCRHKKNFTTLARPFRLLSEHGSAFHHTKKLSAGKVFSVRWPSTEHTSNLGPIIHCFGNIEYTGTASRFHDSFGLSG